MSAHLSDGRDNQVFLGLDVSTQGLKACFLDAKCKVVAEAGINFDKDLPHFKTSGGAIVDAQNSTVVGAPTLASHFLL